MRVFQLVEHKGGDMPARFYMDGRRVSREHYEHIEQQGYSFGRVDTMWTKARQVKGHRTRRTNGKTVHI